MKPHDWNKMNPSEQAHYAAELRDRMRGQLIMGQALARAVVEMRKAPHPETSNIEDMEAIGEGLYEPFFTLYLERATT